MRAEIIRKKMQKMVLKQGVQINIASYVQLTLVTCCVGSHFLSNASLQNLFNIEIGFCVSCVFGNGFA